MEKISDIIESIANEKGLPIDAVKQRVADALAHTAKRLFGDEYEYEATFDEGKEMKLFQKVLIVPDDDERVGTGEQFIALSKAKAVDKNVEAGDELTYEINIENLGRTASMVLAKELNYHIQRLMEETIFARYQSKVGELIHGTVIRVDKDETTFIEFDDIRAFMPRKNRIKGEHFKVGDVVRAVIRKVYIEKNQGIKMEVSRTSPKFLEALLRQEVLEIQNGSVVVQACARIPGERAKVCVSATRPSIDPVGATVGTKGVRINAISKELNGENIDVIEYSAQPQMMISRAMAPAIVNSVTIEGEKATVYISSDQKSKAIGRSGINIRLAGTITGYEITLADTEEKKAHDNEEGLKNLENLFGGL